MKFVICSYHRPALIRTRTLALLQSHKIPASDIFIFVGAANASDWEPYQYLRPEFPNLIQCPVGLVNARNAVTDYFPEGEELVCLDDDLQMIKHKLPGTEWNLKNEFALGFLTARANNYRLVGLYPVANRLWMKTEILLGVAFCYGCCYGLINTKELKQTQDLDFKEDWDRSLWFSSRDGGVVRLEYLAPIQRYRTESGGLESTRTKEAESVGCSVLLMIYPRLIKQTERNGWPELRVTSKVVAERRKIPL